MVHYTDIYHIYRCLLKWNTFPVKISNDIKFKKYSWNFNMFSGPRFKARCWLCDNILKGRLPIERSPIITCNCGVLNLIPICYDPVEVSAELEKITFWQYPEIKNGIVKKPGEKYGLQDKGNIRVLL